MSSDTVANCSISLEILNLQGFKCSELKNNAVLLIL